MHRLQFCHHFVEKRWVESLRQTGHEECSEVTCLYMRSAGTNMYPDPPVWPENKVVLWYDRKSSNNRHVNDVDYRKLFNSRHVSDVDHIVSHGVTNAPMPDITSACVTTGSHHSCLLNSHDDVINWKHFPRCWPFVRGIHRSPVNSPHKGRWRGALMFSLICTLSKQLSKQSWVWWVGTPSSPLWRHCNVNIRIKTC